MLRAWALENGSTAILVCNRFARPYSGRVALTRAFGSVSARLGSGVSLSEKELAVDLPTFGVALVELH